MRPIPFIPKTTPGMPDEYEVTVTYTNGESEKIELVEHAEKPENNKFHFKTSNDTVGWITLSLIAKLEFDHRFIKMKELEAKEKEKLQLVKHE